MPKAINNKKKVFCKQNIPNMLIIFRIVLAVAIVILMLIPFDKYAEALFGEKAYFGDAIYTFKSVLNPDSELIYSNIYLNEIIAGSLFVLACFTDWLDGYIARKNNWVSNFGKLWDPIADKILVNSILICFAYWQMIPAFVPIIMVARDVAVDADKMVAASKGYVIPANVYGKLKTIIQMVAIVVIFFFFNARFNYINSVEIQLLQDDRAIWWGIQNLAMYVACFVSIISGIKYFVEIAQKTKKVKNEQPKN